MPDKMGWRQKAALRQKKRKLTTGGNDPPPEEQRFLTWRMARADFDGDWGWARLEREHLETLRSLFAYYESTPVHVLRQGERIRSIPIHELNPEAQGRLAILEQDDLDELWELRFGNDDWRAWGILDRSRFDLLWWDPGHTVCRGRDRDR